MVEYQKDADYKSKIEKRNEATSSFISAKKHYVRLNGWVIAAQKRRENISHRKETKGYVRYFTLCGREAIDVLLFEREGILRATARGYPDVCYCDYSKDAPLEFTKIREALGKTKGFNMRFQDLVTDSTFSELVRKEPFDIINLDFCGSCFPKYDAPNSATLRSIEKILQLQSNTSFDMFITFHAQRSLENLEAIGELQDTMKKNFEYYDEVETVYNTNVSVPLDQLADDNYPSFLLCAFPKIVLGFGINCGLNGECSKRFYYPRRSEKTGEYYKIVKFIFLFDPIPNNEHFSQRSKRGVELARNYPTAIKNYLNANPIDVNGILKREPRLRKQLDKDQWDLMMNRKKFQI